MQSPLAVVIDEDASLRDDARQALARAGIEVVAVATAREALDILRVHPHAVVVAFPGGPATVGGVAQLGTLCRLRVEERAGASPARIDGRSPASDELRRQLRSLAASQSPVLFSGPNGSGRSHAARCLHGLSNASEGFLVVPADDSGSLEIALTQVRGTIFVASIQQAAWSVQENLASALSSGTSSPRVMASTASDPRRDVDAGRLSPALLAAFGAAIVSVPSLHERREDVSGLARIFLEDVRRLNGLPPIALDSEAIAALESYVWPGNVRQLRSAIESAVILAEGGTVRAKDLPEYVRAAAGPIEPNGRADRRFRDAKRTVVEAFERSYLKDLLERHGGNVTGAAEQSGMLRSALQRLLRKYEFHSADFRRRGDPGRFAS
jgi:two-component system nitrogen regulation response regulator NtrX